MHPGGLGMPPPDTTGYGKRMHSCFFICIDEYTLSMFSMLSTCEIR